MLHDVALHDGIGGHHAYTYRKKDLFKAHRILHLAKTTHGSRNARALRARRDYKLASRELIEAFAQMTSDVTCLETYKNI